jgi:hypothetical protein
MDGISGSESMRMRQLGCGSAQHLVQLDHQEVLPPLIQGLRCGRDLP